jgi:hypothetical protein
MFQRIRYLLYVQRVRFKAWRTGCCGCGLALDHAGDCSDNDYDD